MLYPGKVESWVILLQNEQNSNNDVDPPIVVFCKIYDLDCETSVG